MTKYDLEDWWEFNTPTIVTKHSDKLAWKSEVREELEEMNSDYTFFAVIKSTSGEANYYAENDFTYHRTEQGAIQMIAALAAELEVDFDPSEDNSFYLDGENGAYVEYYVDEREFNE